MTVKKGDKIKVDYVGSLSDGTVFDSSEKHGKPLEVEVGAGHVIKGFDNALEGMKKDEEKTIEIKPTEAYGDHNPQLIKKVPRSQLPKDQEPKEGMILALQTPDGKQFPARITGVNDEEVTIDLNHPLANKTLNFKIKVLDINNK